MTTDQALETLREALRYERSHSQECKANYWGSEASDNLSFDDATTILGSCICSHRDALTALDTLREEVERLDENWRHMSQRYEDVYIEKERLRAQLERQEAALQQLAKVQPETLAMLRREGFKFEAPLHLSDGWEKLAFTLYSTICEVDRTVDAALSTPPNQEDER